MAYILALAGGRDIRLVFKVMSVIVYVVSEWQRSGNPTYVKLAMLIGVAVGLAWMSRTVYQAIRKGEV